MTKKTEAKEKEARRLAIVTGASSGIGTAFAQRLARDGYDLTLVARDRGRLEKLAHELHREAHVHVEVLPADLTDPTELRVIEDYAAQEEALELLVNNAGMGTAGRFVDLDPDREESEIRLNVVALVRLTRAVLPGMIERKHGGIINVSSMAALQPAPNNATYAATKAFVNSFTEAIYEELRGTGICVQALCPGFTRTEFQERAGLDVSRIPSFAWMTAAAVVDASLAALHRGTLICVPGLGNQAVATVAGALPRAVVRRIVGALVQST